MSEIFRKHIEKFVLLRDEEFKGIMSFFHSMKISKKKNLLEGGQICRYHYFVETGLLRKFFITEKGVEQTTEFAIETWWLTDNLAFEHKQVSNFFIQAVEKSELLYISKENQENLVSAFPVMERYFRFVYQRAYAAAQLRIKYLYSLTKEEFYFNLLKKHPEFVQRVPQYLIASYLGFTPEYLSEIRKKRIS
ncbi:hypothetical protein GCM10027036_19920 [Flavihumibacter cheonanensis]|jgi:CRP-like cAMP-binding protein|uniref:Crp/Fnr family transcriptional regulator n=1 Tax=Flavihumibacter cheonanensis TaxID=1442385 RepID=UPI001EF7B982|nr:Crp/Fnr family transcriptional regulator [Flavihumibacter cheonanensis]MCG7754124.1 Crp/Fnr family transcriptional regulator [Flavihumibacter cheonanensis]